MGRISLWGFYQFTDKTLFDNIKLYEGFDKQVLVDLIMQQSGELPPFHQQPTYLKANIENWFNRMYEQFKRMYDALYADYNPLENYDRHEDWSDSESTSLSTSESSSMSGHDSSSDSSSDSMSNSTDNGISAANMTTGFVPDTSSNGVSAGRSSSNSTNDTKNQMYRHNLETRQHYATHGGRIHGNIGVTTNVQMISGELELRKFDIYATIANMFEAEFLTRIY